MNKISLICLTYERHEFVRRQLLYFAGKPINFIIADGSKKALNLKNRGKIGKMNWTYFNISTKDSFFKRLIKASKLVNTKYVCMIDDGDIIFWSGINKLINLLDKKKSYHCAGGFSANGFFLPSKKMVFCKDNLKGIEKTIKLDSSASKRLLKLISMQLTGTVFYSIIRSKLFLNLIKEVYKNRSSYPISNELVWCAFIAIKSKIVIKDIPFCVRMDVPSISLSSQKNTKNIKSRVFSDRGEWENKMPQEPIRLIKYLTSELQKQDGAKIIENNKVIKNFFDIHKNHFTSKFSYADHFLITFTKNFFYHYNINKFWLYNFLMKVLNKLFNQRDELIDFWKKKFKTNLSIEQKKDLQKVRDLLCEYPNGVKKIKSFIK